MFRNSPVTYQNIILLVAALLLCYVHFTFFHGGYLGYDELEYARLATWLVDGRFEHDSLYAFRYMGFIPLALVYYITGPGDFGNWLVPVLTLLSIGWILLLILREKPYWIRFLAVLMLIISPLHLLYLEKPMPDLTTELGVLLCLYSYYRHRWQAGRYSENTDVALFVLGCIIVFLSKESFLIVYPVFLFFFIWDVKHRIRVRYWMKVFSSVVIFIIVYLAFYEVFLGNAFARIDALFTNRYISECTYELQPAVVVFRRIAYELWLSMIRMGMLLPLSFVFVMARGKKGLFSDESGFWMLSWVFLLFVSNFMTISYTSYVPLCPDPRHFLFVLPAGVMVWAYGLEKIKSFSAGEMLIILVVLGVQWFVSWYFDFENHHVLYGLIMAGLIICRNGSYVKIAILLIAAGLFSVFIQNAIYNRGINHPGQKELIQKILSVNSNPKWILTDGANANIGSFYAGYSNTYQFVVFHEFDENVHQDGEMYILLNGMTAYYSNTDWDKVPEFVKTAEGKLPLFFENQSGKVYKVR